MHMIFFPSMVTGMASHTNLRLLVQAKSRTLSALKIKVFVFVLFVFSAAFASAKVTISTGSLLVCAFCQRANCAAVRFAA